MAAPFWMCLALTAAPSAALPRQIGTPPAPTSASLDATAIYDRARATVAARTLPAFIAYTQDTAFRRNGNVRAEHARVILRMADGKANVTRIPDSPADRVDTQPAVKDRPLVYPTTSFGLVKRRIGEQPSTFESTSPPIPSPDSGPAVIGRVASMTRDYDASLVDTQTLNGAAVYHLKLVPRFDPRQHPIREMYIDATTFDPRRIAIEVWAQAGPVRSRPTVIVDFAPVDGVWLIAHASINFVLRMAFLSYAGSAEFRTSNIEFPSSEPAWMFDSKLLAAHRTGAQSSPEANRKER